MLPILTTLVIDYNAPYAPKYEPPNPQRFQCTVLGIILPCHKGFEYEEPEGRQSLPEQPEPPVVEVCE